jgi:C4-type Zn-finger protein
LDECIKSRPYKKSRITTLHGTVKQATEELQDKIQEQKHNEDWIENTQKWLTSSKLLLEKDCKMKSEFLMYSYPDEKNNRLNILDLDQDNSIDLLDF